jgi:serine/threonine protein kinase/Tol biopolymer transport system component
MPLSPGVRLGPYEILDAIGAGGMGEVYRARDSRLARDVALKVLPEAFARDADRMLRFEREAKVLAALNHPNIASLYGLEESNGARALVMELVEGTTLAERIKRGSLPIEEALLVAKQIADGLEYAHERGIIHRDLKPSNVKRRPDGQVKILDFGLAKALEGEASDEVLQNSPTLSAGATRTGVLLGTAAYMSPEQVRCKRVDRRADIWAFGCVLYEMLTGLGAFTGETISDNLASVIRAQPEWSFLPAGVPPRIREVLRLCLQKDAKQRLQAVGDARITIEEVLAGAPDVVTLTAPADAHPKLRERMTWIAVVGLLTLVSTWFGVGYFSRTPKPPQPIVSQIGPPENTKFILTGLTAGPPVLSPDGTFLAFAARSADGKQFLWVRSLDGAVEEPLAETEGATFPFWSPNSRSLAFFANGKLDRIDATGGPVLTVCDAVSGRGGSWGTDGTILFAGLSGPIFRVPASGGTPQQVTKLDESLSQFSHRWAQFLPDGIHFLFFGQATASGNSTIYIGSLDGGAPKVLLRNESNAIYAPPGYLLFVRQGTLVAQRFDANRLQLMGDAAPLAEHEAVDSSLRRGDFSVSENGILVYASGALSEGRLLWFDRNGKQLGGTGAVDAYGFPRISPDGRKLAVSKVSGPSSSTIWILDLDRGTSSRLTFSPGRNDLPAWSPDGKLIAFVSTQGGNRRIYQQAVNGTGAATSLVIGDADEILPSWSSDGRYLIFQTHSNQGNSQWEIWAQPLFGDHKAFPVAQKPQSLQGTPALSPDGKWLANDSDESGRIEVYVTPFLHGGGKWQVSTGGGSCPRWRADGRELFYMSLENKIMSAEISAQTSSVVIGKVQQVFQANPVPFAPECMYDVSADGKKIVVVTLAVEQGSQPLTLIVNWPPLLKKGRQQ